MADASTDADASGTIETVLVTGGLGRSGRWIVDRLADEGYETIAVDLDHPGFPATPRSNVDFRAADLTDRGETFELVAETDPDAVVHWAAIPAPERHAGGRVFETNVLSAYAVLQAAGEAGATVVQASSESAYGFPFAADPLAPDYLPVDETHPMRPEDPYGTGKIVAEDLAEMVTRRHGVPVASIRPSWIQLPGDYACREIVESGPLVDGIGNFWSYVDVRDVAGIVLAALEADLAGHEPYLAAASDTYLGRPVIEALRETDAFDADAIDGAADLEGESSALSTAKARADLGFEPTHGWREAADEDVPVPDLVI